MIFKDWKNSHLYGGDGAASLGEDEVGGDLRTGEGFLWLSWEKDWVDCTTGSTGEEGRAILLLPSALQLGNG